MVPSQKGTAESHYEVGENEGEPGKVSRHQTRAQRWWYKGVKGWCVIAQCRWQSETKFDKVGDGKLFSEVSAVLFGCPWSDGLR